MLTILDRSSTFQTSTMMLQRPRSDLFITQHVSDTIFVFILYLYVG